MKPQGITSDPNAGCESCGSFVEVLEIAGHLLCGDCLALAGGGCACHGCVEEN